MKRSHMWGVFCGWSVSMGGGWLDWSVGRVSAHALLGSFLLECRLVFALRWSGTAYVWPRGWLELRVVVCAVVCVV